MVGLETRLWLRLGLVFGDIVRAKDWVRFRVKVRDRGRVKASVMDNLVLVLGLWTLLRLGFILFTGG